MNYSDVSRLTTTSIVGLLMVAVSFGSGCNSSKCCAVPAAGSGGAGALGGGSGEGGASGSPGDVGGNGGSQTISGPGGYGGGAATAGYGGGATISGSGGQGGGLDCYQQSRAGSLGGGAYGLCGGFAGATGSVAPTSYTLTPGTNCFRVTGPYCLDDGCCTYVSYASVSETPVTYDAVAGTIAFPSLGTGSLVLNGDRATGTTSGRAGFGLEGPQLCSYLFTTESALVLTGNDAFALSLRQTKSDYDELCSRYSVEPAAGACTSSWTLTMTLDPTETFQSGGCY